MHAGDIGLGPSPHDLSPPLPPPPPASLQPALPPAPLPDLARKLDPRPMPLHALPATQHHNFCQCWAFLKLLVLCPGKYTDLSTHPQGTSWLELFCVFFCLGGSLSTQAGGGAAPKPSLRLQLVLFKRIVLLVSKVALSEGDRRFLVPSKSTMCRLKGMGFCNHVACISGEALFDDQLRTRVTLGLLSLRMSVTLRVKQSLRTGNLWIKPTKVSYRGTPAWERMGRLSSCVPNETHAAVSSESHVQAFSRLASVFFAVCPRCHAPRDTTRITLMRHGMWVSITCVECSFTASSRKWDCLCGSCGMPVLSMQNEVSRVARPPNDTPRASLEKGVPPTSSRFRLFLRHSPRLGGCSSARHPNGAFFCRPGARQSVSSLFCLQSARLPPIRRRPWLQSTGFALSEPPQGRAITPARLRAG